MNCHSSEHRVTRYLFDLINDGYRVTSRKESRAGEEYTLAHSRTGRKLTLLWFPRLSYLQLCDKKRILKAIIL